MLNLLVEFGFQLFDIKTLFYFKLRISAGMNPKMRNITLSIPTTFRSTEMFKNVGISCPERDSRNTCLVFPVLNVS